jgi:AAA15 family ATPase/GTPase
MLIRFRVSNFLSFKEETELSMIPGLTQQHPEHVVRTGKQHYDIRILRTSVIYGANASGKSNLVKAMHFARELIVEGAKPKQTIGVKPFKLDHSCADKPARFEFEFRHNGRNYWYGFEVDSTKVHTEWLHELKKTTHVPIFERTTPNGEKTMVQFGNLEISDKKEGDFLDFVAIGTRPNQLFLHESIERNVKQFEQVYQWFDKALVIIFPDSHYLINLDVQAKNTQAVVQYLEQFDTGVCGFSLQTISPEGELPSDMLKDLSRDLKTGNAVRVMQLSQFGTSHYLVSKNEEQELEVSKLMLKHRMRDGNEEVSMDTTEESDGTVRLMDLIPILTRGEQESRVYVIDELDRSLHPILCYRLIEQFLAQPNKTSQVIVTTHETNLLDLALLRRDEIWFVEKDTQGVSHTYSLEEFSPRYDKDIQKGYLLGRFGAIPFMGRQQF